MLRCGNCIYYEADSTNRTVGYCRLYPPMPSGRSPYPYATRVAATSWCGQGEEIEVYKKKKHQMQVRAASFLGVVFPETTLPTEEEKV